MAPIKEATHWGKGKNFMSAYFLVKLVKTWSRSLMHVVWQHWEDFFGIHLFSEGYRPHSPFQARVFLMSDWHSKFYAISKKKSFRFGLPFILMIVGGSFFLEQFAQNRYRFSKRMPITPEVAEQYGVKMKKPGEVTLESEYEKIKDMDVDNWSNKRGPRPWE